MAYSNSLFIRSIFLIKKSVRKSIYFLTPNRQYGLCSTGALWKLFKSALGNVWHKILPKGGVIRSAPRDLRQLSGGFFGVGYPHLGVECLVQQVAKLHPHYGCRSDMGLKLKVLLETLAVEMGVSYQLIVPTPEGNYNVCWLGIILCNNEINMND